MGIKQIAKECGVGIGTVYSVIYKGFKMNTEEKNCPFCGETIKAVAIKCKHCQSDLISNSAKEEPVRTESKIEQIRKIREETGASLSEAIEKIDGVNTAKTKYKYFSTWNLVLYLTIPLTIWAHYERMERNNKDFFGNAKTITSQSNENISTPKLNTVKYICAGGLFNFVISNEKVTMEGVSDYFKFLKMEMGARGQGIFVYKFTNTNNNEGLTYDPALEIISLIKFNGSDIADSKTISGCVKK